MHIVLITAVFLLYQQLQSLKSEQEHELKKVIDYVVEEIRAENERLRIELKERKKLNERIEHPTKIDSYRSNEVQVTPPTPIKDRVETSPEATILQLHEQGLSIAEIAQKLNRGKTEVELIVKLAKEKV